MRYKPVHPAAGARSLESTTEPLAYMKTKALCALSDRFISGWLRLITARFFSSCLLILSCDGHALRNSG